MEIGGKIGNAGKRKSGGKIWSGGGDDEKSVKDEKRGTDVEWMNDIRRGKDEKWEKSRSGDRREAGGGGARLACKVVRLYADQRRNQ